MGKASTSKSLKSQSRIVMKTLSLVREKKRQLLRNLKKKASKCRSKSRMLNFRNS